MLETRRNGPAASGIWNSTAEALDNSCGAARRLRPPRALLAFGRGRRRVTPEEGTPQFTLVDETSSQEHATRNQALQQHTDTLLENSPGASPPCLVEMVEPRA